MAESTNLLSYPQPKAHPPFVEGFMGLFGQSTQMTSKDVYHARYYLGPSGETIYSGFYRREQVEIGAGHAQEIRIEAFERVYMGKIPGTTLRFQYLENNGSVFPLSSAIIHLPHREGDSLVLFSNEKNVIGKTTYLSPSEFRRAVQAKIADPAQAGPLDDWLKKFEEITTRIPEESHILRPEASEILSFLNQAAEEIDQPASL